MNLCVISGNLGGDPDLKKANNGTEVTTFQIAFKSNKDKTNWIKVVCFGKLAQIAESNLQKGIKVVISGSLDYNEWTNSDGEDKSQFQLIANSIEFFKEGKKGNEVKKKSKDNDDDVPF